jgi:hypothetical protein
VSEKTEQSTKVITGKVRASYCHVFTPSSVDEGGEKKYSVSLIIPKSDTATIDKIKAAIAAATEAGKGKWENKIPKNLKTPLRDGDVDRDGDEAYADAYFINATSKTKPGIIDLMKAEITDPEGFYSGCFCRASLNFYAFNTKGNKGIAAGLNNLQKVADGEPLGGGRAKAEDDFDDEYELDEDDDLLG